MFSTPLDYLPKSSGSLADRTYVTSVTTGLFGVKAGGAVASATNRDGGTGDRSIVYGYVTDPTARK